MLNLSPLLEFLLGWVMPDLMVIWLWIYALLWEFNPYWISS